MSKKPAISNAKQALNQMKLEVANELGISNSNIDGSNDTSYKNGRIGGNLGGIMSRRLVEMGEEQLLREYNKKNK